MKSIYAKLSLFVLLASTALAVFGRPNSLRRIGMRDEKEFRSLVAKAAPMDLDAFKRFIDSVNLSETELGVLRTRLLAAPTSHPWRDAGAKMLFLAEKISPQTRRENGLGAELVWAYEHNDKAMIKKLRAIGGDMSRALEDAVNRKPSLIPVLLKEGALPNRDTLIIAIFHSRRDRMLRSMLPRLFKAAKNINERDDETGETLLFYTIGLGNKDVAKMLIDAGIRIDVQNDAGYTALAQAVLQIYNYPPSPNILQKPYVKPYVELIAYLIQQGADPNIKNKKGESALSIAREAGLTDLVTLFEGSKGSRRRRPR